MPLWKHYTKQGGAFCWSETPKDLACAMNRFLEFKLKKTGQKWLFFWNKKVKNEKQISKFKKNFLSMEI